jgi:hypothetical protein
VGDATATLAPRWVAALSAAMIVLLWGGILVIAAIERRLPTDVQWMGHVTVHVWTAANASVIAAAAFRGLRRGWVPGGPLPMLVRAAGVLAIVAVVAGLLDAVGAYPPASAIHDPVNAVAAPVGWMLLLSLALVTLVGLATRHVGAQASH